MTPAERANPKMIDGSRRPRIAKGSGRQVSDVNSLVDRFFEARKMMQQMARGGWHPRDAGHARACPGWAWRGQARQGQGAAQEGQGRKRVSGNPAKAAQEAAAEREKAAASAGNPFGQPGGEDVDYEKAAAALDLPKDFSKFLK